MGRKSSVDESELLQRLGEVFRNVGYEGATLTALSEAAGLQKASLYHRFPGGKEQMAQEVLQHAGNWLEAHLLGLVRSPSGSSVSVRISRLVECLDEFYSGGEQDCLLNALSLGNCKSGGFSLRIKELMLAWVDALSSTLMDAGMNQAQARARAERALVGLQGSLVVSRGLGTTRPFKTYLEELPGDLLNEEGARHHVRRSRTVRMR